MQRDHSKRRKSNCNTKYPERFFIPKKGIFNHNLSHKPSTGKSEAVKDEVPRRELGWSAAQVQPVGYRTHKTSCRKWVLYLYHGRPHLTTCSSLRGSRQPPHTFQLHLRATKYAHIISQRIKLYQKHQYEKGKIFSSWWVTCYLDSVTKARS